MVGHYIYLTESLQTLEKIMIASYLTNNKPPTKAHLFLSPGFLTPALPFKSVAAHTPINPRQQRQNGLNTVLHSLMLFPFYIISPPSFLIWRIVLIL